MTNVLVIVADDMRYDHLPYVPNVRRLIQEPGRTFTGARCNVALCQPNRVGLFTGQLSREHGELGIGYGAPTFADNDNTLGAWASEAGHRTGLLGKYVNYWDGPWPNFGKGPRPNAGIAAPRGWDVWRQLTDYHTASDWWVRNQEDPLRITGVFPTDYLADEVRSFLEGDEPWVCCLAPQQPHEPFAPHPKDLHAWSHARFRQVPVPDATAKPAWVRNRAPISDAEWSQLQQGFRGRLRELTAVDRLVGEAVTALEDRGQLHDTVIIFTSDNGVHQGEQRRGGEGTKAGPYDVGLRVPLVVRGPGFPPGPAVTTPVYPMQDITTTVLAITGGTARLPKQAGLDLRELLSPSAHRQRTLLHEVGSEGFDTTGDGITTGPRHHLGHHKLFRYPSVRSKLTDPPIYELYDLAADPDELTNLADRAEHRARRDALERELDALLEA